MSQTNKYNIEEYGIYRPILEQVTNLPYGFESEVYFNPKTNEMSFSEPMTHNTWTRSNDCIGRIKYFSISDLEGWQEIDDDFVEVDDGVNQTDPGYENEECPRYYTNSSIITLDDAMDRLASLADDEDWYSDIVSKIVSLRKEAGVE